MRRILLALVMLLSASANSNADEIFSDNFDPPLLAGKIWCKCQITQPDTPLNLWRDQHDGVTGVTITVNETSVGGKACEPDCKVPPTVTSVITAKSAQEADDDFPESLGPRLINKTVTTTMKSASNNTFCDAATKKRGELRKQKDEDPCSQRQELRLQKNFRLPSSEVQTYSFRFRMPKPVFDTKKSIRWITAQWKQEPYDTTTYGKALPTGASPVVAQRFDDGILWITVQSGHCRCVIASSSKTDTHGRAWTDGKPTDCMTIDAREPPGSMCKPEPNLDVRYDPGWELVSPAGQWVEMKYVMKFTGKDGGFLAVNQNGKHVLTVTGLIGYEPKPGEPPMTKFKMGIYRDYIPQEDMIDVDWIKVEKD